MVILNHFENIANVSTHYMQQIPVYPQITKQRKYKYGIQKRMEWREKGNFITIETQAFLRKEAEKKKELVIVLCTQIPKA